MEADDTAPLKVKEDEVSALRWFTLEEFKTLNCDIMEVYLKMLKRLED